MPTSTSKADRASTSIKGSKPSSKTSDHTPVIEKLQQENAQLLRQLEERNTMGRHLHHDNAVLQEKVNSLQRLVDQITDNNRSLRAQLKNRKSPKTKSPRQAGEDSKANPPPPLQV
jgi:regulatory protein YycI of two-component signal transduction system YycFG